MKNNGYKQTVVIGILGPVLDNGVHPERWERWRPTVSLCQHEDLLVSRFELLYEAKFETLCSRLVEDIAAVSPETVVRPQTIKWRDPWDFQDVYGALHDYATSVDWNTDEEDYLVHITTGTHVAQICMFLLTESRHLPGRLIQTSPPPRRKDVVPGEYCIIDLDLSKYDRLASRFAKEQRDSTSFLKSGIETRNLNFNQLIDRIERVASASRSPILLMGPTGAGKSQLARRVYELKHLRRQLSGPFVEVNCATLRGDSAMSSMFGHVKGSFTGAQQDRPGLLRAANNGLLFLDEIGELGLDEQAMLLRALEDRRFLPVGADKEVGSEFQLIAGTNCDLACAVRAGKFREDLLARINLWTFVLPALKDRPEDIEPNLRYELDKAAETIGARVTFSKEAESRFLKFATSPDAIWSGNFRDLNAAVTRMATLADGGRITVAIVDEEIARLRQFWIGGQGNECRDMLTRWLSPDAIEQIDRFDQVQLAEVLRVCTSARSLSEAGRVLFAASRKNKQKINDADRLKKYLARYTLEWRQLQ